MSQIVMGRPRDTAVDEKIADAVVALIARLGYAGTTIERVAQETGIGRPTIYRRYANRKAMIAQVVASLIETVPEPLEADDPYENVVNHLVNTIEMLKKTPVGPVLRAAISEAADDEALSRMMNDIGMDRRRRLTRAMQQAIDAGVVVAPRNLEALIDGLVGAIYFRYLMTSRSLNRAYAQKLLASFAR